MLNGRGSLQNLVALRFGCGQVPLSALPSVRTGYDVNVEQLLAISMSKRLHSAFALDESPQVGKP